MCILTFLRSISQEGVVEDKDAMRLPTSIKVTEGKLSVIYTGIQCDRIIFFLATEDTVGTRPINRTDTLRKQSSQSHYGHLHIYYAVILD